jgi:hypothetical protein
MSGVRRDSSADHRAERAPPLFSPEGMLGDMSGFEEYRGFFPEVRSPQNVRAIKVFKNAGYVTAHIGKWHLGYTPRTDLNSPIADKTNGHRSWQLYLLWFDP